ncbi:ABC transporter ATP-binding protein [Peribacillus frigoritolerans]|uniref:ABC transporter ATP-binding protein n=1 Tax=Peribacillus frigoritolerans TaxID=450367 RepID=UPI003830F055
MTDTVTFIAVAVYMLFINSKLTIVLLITFPFMLYITRVFGKRIRMSFRSVQSSAGDVSNQLQDSISGMRLIQSFTNEEFESLRGQMGIVSQDIILFNGSIPDNIVYGKLNATDDEIIESAKAANAHDFISAFPDGYDSQIGERGVKLSGGQKQRIAIVRALLKNPQIIILDEATAALDKESEHLIQQALSRLMKKRTSIVVAHRLSTIHDADQIIVLEKGQVHEKGSHEQLMQNNGRYKQLHDLQFPQLKAISNY